jgi:putative ABC transport system substrate-binding protein
VKRREFIKLIGGAAAGWPLVAGAQSKPAVVAVIGSGFATSSAIFIDSFKLGMSENGLTDGRDYMLEVRWAEGNYTRFPALVAELTQRNPNVMIVTTIAAARVAQQVAPATALVMTGLIDPIGAGLIASLARPGGNTTGLTSMVQDMTAKGLELLRTAIPATKAIAVLFNPANSGNRQILEDLHAQATTLKMTIVPIEFTVASGLDAAIQEARGSDALLILGDAALIDQRERIAELALQHRLPTVTSIPEFTDVGALIGYGPSRRDIWRRAATYVKKLLDGAKAADLPVEQPTLIELSINMRTARALSITIPDTLVARADRIIE